MLLVAAEISAVVSNWNGVFYVSHLVFIISFSQPIALHKALSLGDFV